MIQVVGEQVEQTLVYHQTMSVEAQTFLQSKEPGGSEFALTTHKALKMMLSSAPAKAHKENQFLSATIDCYTIELPKYRLCCIFTRRTH